jgi:hypothetical protein
MAQFRAHCVSSLRMRARSVVSVCTPNREIRSLLQISPFGQSCDCVRFAGPHHDASRRLRWLGDRFRCFVISVLHLHRQGNLLHGCGGIGQRDGNDAVVMHVRAAHHARRHQFWITASANSLGLSVAEVAPNSSSLFTIPSWFTASAKSFEIFATIAGGVPAGATTPTQDVTSKPGTVSAMAGTSGASGVRVRLATPSARSVPRFTCGQTVLILSIVSSTLPAMRSLSAGATAKRNHGPCVSNAQAERFLRPGLPLTRVAPRGQTPPREA